ncbi:hypothetical protein TcasGA2_TC005110 [Tribolium castaneum]|uniref:Uncharacterized protein n=1 Tax=Tribolium castaneum TaxID=7070 RepID=D7EL98_TRICA|nr:hypothetical protein TcasGA2_TC005110 [Tribolium castaneum]
MVDNNPTMSTSEISLATAIGQSSVNRILKRHKFHPYHLQLHQELYGNDFENRIIFSRSPNLTAPDFFLWGTVKEMVYREAPTTIEDMRERIQNAFTEMNELNLAARVHANFKRRIRLCLDQNGHQFEHLM